MDISQAKEQIKQCVQIYLSKDAFGAYHMPVERQRPVFLLGAPGIGKTAIMEQIAEELDLPLVTYSMTHHTRQSALGLPMIMEKNYQGETMSVTGYTLSEIIVALYETMEKTGSREGILFLDEINCVSETLAPAMLQFLQYKTFGNHRIPDGWVIVTAGNPPQYNRSVREFDIVTLDRLKVMKIEPEYEAWSRYAKQKGLHFAVQAYLDLNKDDFYILETTKNGKQYVTARGWEDLAEAIALYEENGFPVEESLIGQYLRHERICTQFATYYRLYRKYKQDYGIRAVLNGQFSETAQKLEAAGVDEKITVARMFAETMVSEIQSVQEKVEGLFLIRKVLREIKEEPDILALLEEKRVIHENDLHGGRHLASFCQIVRANVAYENEATAKEQVIRIYTDWSRKLKGEIQDCSKKLENCFAFLDTSGDRNEMLIFVTELSVNTACNRFLFDHPSPGYLKYSSLLAMGERKSQLLKQMEALDREEQETNGSLPERDA